jgi:hypothetical protein
MFYTLPGYEVSPPGETFESFGAEPGTQVWRAVRLSMPKFWFLVEFHGGDRASLTQTVMCSEIEPVLSLVGESWVSDHAVSLCVPSSASASGTGGPALVGLREVLEGSYRPGLFKAAQPAYIFVANDGRRFVEIAGLDEATIKNPRSVYCARQRGGDIS